MNSTKEDWEKLGKIQIDNKNQGWLTSYAAVPIAEHYIDDIFKVFVTTRNEKNQSNLVSFFIDLNYPTIGFDLSPDAIFTTGKMGCFDDSGVMATWITPIDNNTKFLYYIGWNLGVTVPFRNSIGLATVSPDGGITRNFDGPIVDRSPTEPHFCASCCVIKENGIWHMWYLSCVEWIESDINPIHKYHIKYASSKDGINWSRTGKVAINFKDDEIAISRPSVINDEDLWKMWFSHRGDHYKIGYAESLDGQNWKRIENHSNLNVSATGWDSEMVEYPFVFDHKGERYMLYNGNGYGKSGVGIARWIN